MNIIQKLLKKKKPEILSGPWYMKKSTKKLVLDAADKQADEMSVERIHETESALKRFVDVDWLVQRFCVTEGNPLEPKASADALYGAIYGDILGSRYEGSLRKPEAMTREEIDRYCAVTDDSVLSLATAEAIMAGVSGEDIHSSFANKKGRARILDDIRKHRTLHGHSVDEFASHYKEWADAYPDAGYGPAFFWWTNEGNLQPYGSRGNGAAMRVSPIGAAGQNGEWVIKTAIASAACTHDDFDGIRGAIVEAAAVWMACAGAPVEDIYKYMVRQYERDGVALFHAFTMREVRSIKYHQVESQFSVPAAIIAVHESASFDDAIMNAMTAGMDTDTNACIAGAIAAETCGIEERHREIVRSKLDERQMKTLEAWERFCEAQDKRK